MTNETMGRLRARLAEVYDIQKANSVLGWDQHTYMPPGGAGARAEQMATLSRLSHERFVDDAVGAMLEELTPYASSLPFDDDDASLIRVTKRDWDKKRRIPPELIAEKAKAVALAYEAWQKARTADDYSMFAPHLERVIDVTGRVAEALGYEDRKYDALLDLYETDAKTADVEAVFGALKGELVPLVQAIAEKGDVVDDMMMRLGYDEDTQ